MGPQPGQKTVLITGCTPGGIGHALAMEFHAKGLHVIATARNPTVLDEMAAAGMSALALDVTNAESIKACHDEVAKITGGTLDILVNNAGRTHTHPALDVDIDDVRATFETNVFGVMATCQAFSDLLIAARGLIINIASLAAAMPYVFGSVYCASKGAVVSYSRTLRLEIAPFGVRVMVAMTGTVRSNIASRTHRTLPPTSLYRRIQDIFQWRLTYSQTQTVTMSTDEYARRLVAVALRPEVPAFLRPWFGRPDWFWCGGQSGKAQFGIMVRAWLGESVTDMVTYRMFRLPQLERVLREEAKQKKLK